MGNGIKFPPVQKEWELPENAHSFQEATAHYGNVGALAGIGPYGGLDQDEPEAFKGLPLPEHTTAWETRPGRFGMRFIWHDRTPEVLAKYGFKPDQSQIYLFDSSKIVNGYHPGVGEVKLERAYQVIPPSWKFLEDGKRADYKLLDAAPPAEISLDQLLSDLLKIGIVFSKSPKKTRLKTNAKKLEALPQNAAKGRKDKTAKAKELFNRALQAGSAPHNRNSSGFDLACQLRDLGLSADEAADYMSLYARGAPTGDHPYTESDALESLRQAFSREPREPPKSEERRQNEEIVKTLPEKIKADPRSIKTPEVIEALAALRTNDPLEYDLVLAEIKKNCRDIRLETLRAVVEKHITDRQPAAKSPDRCPEVSEDITTAAREIIKEGKAYEYIHKTWQKRVKGNEHLGKALIVSRGTQSCDNTKGIHVYAHGKHGHGKSEGMEQMLRLCPPEYRMDEDVSPLAIHYASKNGMLLPGTTILIDEMIWSDSLGGIVKRITTRFQQGAGHLTVIDGEPVLVKTQPRLAIWTNSADLQADEQLRDRFLDEPITEGDGYVSEIIEFQKLRDTLPTSSEETTRETAICQEIFRDLAGRVFTVKIPFAERINILATEGTRGYNIFSDLIKGLAVLRYAIREKNDQGQLLATKDDFGDAKDIYEGSKGHSEEHYTTAEIRVLQAIIDNGYKALYKDIKNKTGMSEGRVKDIVNGRGKDEQKRHGLRYKCTSLDVSTVDISTVIAGTQNDRVTVHPVELSLPHGFTVADGARQLVSLNPDVGRRNPDVDPDVVQTNNNNNPDVVDVVKDDKEGEDKESKLLSSSNADTSSLRQNRQKDYVTTSQLSQLSIKADVVDTSGYVGYVAVSADAEKHYVEVSKTGDGREELPAASTASTTPPRLAAKAVPNSSQTSQKLQPAEKGDTSRAAKARLWDDIRPKLKKYARVDGKRRGIAETDLQADEVELIQDAGWPRETTSTGISIFWIPEKAAAAMGLEPRP